MVVDVLRSMPKMLRVAVLPSRRWLNELLLADGQEGLWWGGGSEGEWGEGGEGDVVEMGGWRGVRWEEGDFAAGLRAIRSKSRPTSDIDWLAGDLGVVLASDKSLRRSSISVRALRSQSSSCSFARRWDLVSEREAASSSSMEAMRLLCDVVDSWGEREEGEEREGGEGGSGTGSRRFGW